MTEPVQWLAIGATAMLFVLVLELVRRRDLAEEYSLVWLAVSIGLFVVAVKREILHLVARELGVHYPPAVLVLGLVFLGFVGAMFFSVVISRQRKQIERLIEDTAILSAQLRELQDQVAKEVMASG